jgi:hypothetical protein
MLCIVSQTKGKKMIQSVNVNYQGVFIEVVVDGAGLDTIMPNRTEESSAIEDELFKNVVDNYRSMGLVQALENAGAIVNVKQG